DPAAEIREATTRAVDIRLVEGGVHVTAMGAGRRVAGPDHHRVGAGVRWIERVAPAGRKILRALVVDRRVEILEAVAGRLDHHDAFADRVSDGGKIVRPPLDRDIAELTLVVRVWAGTMNLEQQNVARP